ncbi:hypothetical protein niasHT_022550 [Heterodera trifolii]|uniref:C2 domain-containing protein n=1 Tax=Heterodera trifolii TaxID=157864 RepID=A0ABD2JRC0_9BILA
MNFHYVEPSMDDLENDEELLAELRALASGARSDNIKKDRAHLQNGPTMRIGVELPRQSVIDDVLTNITDNLPEEEAWEDEEEMDVDDEDLLNELSELTGRSVELSPTAKREFQRTSTGEIEMGKTSPPRNVSPKRPKTSDDAELTNETEKVPVDPMPSASIGVPNVPPPLPPARTSSISLPQKVDLTQQHGQKPAVDAVKRDSSDNDEVLENRAKNLLVHRRKLYMDRSLAAKRANDRAAAIEAFQTVKMFNQALQAISGGAQLSEDDLCQIPPSPPPYEPPPTQSLAKDSCQISKDSPPVALPDDSAIRKPIVHPSMSEELQLVLTRQLQLKREALAAKKRGDLTTAKEFLSLALRVGQMVEAAKCGIPIDIQQLPELHSNASALPKSATRKMETINEETLKKCKLLEKELIKQIAFCEERMSKFQSAGDSKNTLLYEGLLQQSKNDLQRVQLAALGQTQLPNFKLPELSLPIIQLNSSISDDKLMLRIKKVEHLKLPEGWKPSDCALYVFFKFPFPHGTHQTGRTPTIKGTNSPEFTDVFQLDINRKTKQFLRICKRQPLKLEIYQKGGFLRSDKLFANADIPMQELEKSATICSSFPLLEGRKKMGGNVQIEIHIRKPLGDAFDAATNTKRKWVKLDA